MPVYLSDPSVRRAYEQAEARRNRVISYQAQYSAQPYVPDALSALVQAYPHMPAGVLFPLASQGLGPESEEARALVAQHMAQSDRPKRDEGFFGSLASAWDSVRDGIGSAYGGVKAVGGAVLPDEFGQAVNAVTDAVPGAVTGTAKGISRGMFAGLESIGQSMQAEFRQNYADDGRISAGEVVEGVFSWPEHLMSPQTTLGAGHAEVMANGGYPGLLTGRTKVDFGSGFFAGGNVKRRQTHAARAAAPLIGGSAASLGRWFARDILDADPGTDRYRILSGIVDGALTLATDPSMYLGGAVVKPLQARRMFAGSDEVVEVALPESKAKMKARAFGAGQATPQEFTQDAIRHGSDNPQVQSLVDAVRSGLATPEEMVQDITRLRSQIEVDAGLLETATRKTTLPMRGYEWLTQSREGKRVSKYISAEKDFERMRQALPKVPVRLLPALLDAETTDDVLRVLGPELGVSIDEKFRVARADYGSAVDTQFNQLNLSGLARRKRRNTRMFNRLPAAYARYDDLDDAVEQVNRFLLNAKVPHEVRSVVNRKVAESTSRAGFEDAVTDAYEAISKQLQKEGVPRQRAHLLTRAWKKMVNDSRYFVDDAANNVVFPGASYRPTAVIQGELVNAAEPQLVTQMLQGEVPLASIRDIRRVMASDKIKHWIDPERMKWADDETADALRHAQGVAGRTFATSTELLDWVRDTLWTPSRLFRGSYTIRNIADGLLRMSIMGLDAFSHPMHYWSWVASLSPEELGKVTGMLVRGAKRAGIKPAGGTDVLGRDWHQQSELANFMDSYGYSLERRGATGYRDEFNNPTMLSHEFRVYVKGNDDHADGYMEAWGHQLRQLAKDPVAKRAVAGLFPGDGLPANAQHLSGRDAVKVWLSEGAGRKVLQTLRDNQHLGPKLATREGVDAYVDYVYDLATHLTRGNAELMEAVGTGRLRGVRMWKGDQSSPDFQRVLRTYYDDAPDTVVGPVIIGAEGGVRGVKLLQRMNDAMGNVYNMIGTVPENVWVRAPVFKQAYWQRIGRLAEHLDEKSTAKLLDMLDRQNLPKKMDAAIRKNATRRMGDLTLQSADEIAQHHAFRYLTNWIYTSHEKGQFYDILRNVVVFGNAWQNALRVYSKALAQNPQAMGKLGLAVQGARDTNPNGDERGFFYRDPQFGEERYATPVTWLTKKMTGADIGVSGSVKGLNIVTQSIIPGLGPAASWSASQLIPDHPDFDPVRKVLMPYGESTSPVGDLGPTWLRRLVLGLGEPSPQQKEILASSTISAMAYLASTGSYDWSNPEDLDDLPKDAEGLSQGMSVIRGIAQFILPSAPSLEWMAEDKNGKLHVAYVLAEEYRELQKLEREGKIEDAQAEFVGRHGDLAFMVTIPKTEAENASGPYQAVLDFERRHPDVVRKYPKSWGLFVPDDGEFVYAAYKRQLDTGQRRRRTPEEVLQLTQQYVAANVLRQAKAVAPDDRDYHRAVRDELMRRYPKYDPFGFDPSKTRLAIRELERAVDDPVLSKTEAGRGLAMYLQAREYAKSAYVAAGGKSPDGWGSADRSGGPELRAWLKQVANAIDKQHPGFTSMFDRALIHEMKED